MRHTLILATAVAGVALAPAAHADDYANDQAFLREFHDRVPVQLFTRDSTRVTQGHKSCADLRAGQTVDETAAQWTLTDGRALVEAAQHNICPDTLH